MGAIVVKRSGKDDFWASRRPTPQEQGRPLENWTEGWLERIDRDRIWGDKPPRGRTVVGTRKPDTAHDASSDLGHPDRLLATPHAWDECTPLHHLARRRPPPGGRSLSEAANLGRMSSLSAPARRSNMSKTSANLVLEDVS